MICTYMNFVVNQRLSCFLSLCLLCLSVFLSLCIEIHNFIFKPKKHYDVEQSNETHGHHQNHK